MAQWNRDLVLYCRGLGHCCDVGLIPGLGTLTCHGHSKKKKKKSSCIAEMYSLVVESLPLILSNLKAREVAHELTCLTSFPVHQALVGRFMLKKHSL